jgi:mRNA interferase MazF
VSDRPALRRGDVVLSEVGPTGGRVIQKRRPLVVVSPDEINAQKFTYLAAALTTGNFPYRYRIPCEFAGRKGHVALDQIFTLDAEQVGTPIGRLKPQVLSAALEGLREMFEE